jgi:hypothetical protein
MLLIPMRMVCILGLVCLCTGGCAQLQGTRIKDDPYSFRVVGPVEIDVRSFNGDVLITTDELAEWGTVQVIREGTHGYGRVREARDSLYLIQYTVDLLPGEVGPRLEIRTFTEHAEEHFQRAHVHITMPEIRGVYVRTTNGRVNAQGVKGPVDISTNNGDVRVMTRRPMRDVVTVTNGHGDIDYRVSGDSTGLFDARTVGGRVSHRVREGRFIVGALSGESRLSAQLNFGENPITLRTVSGDIRIAVVQNPEDIGAFIVE